MYFVTYKANHVNFKHVNVTSLVDLLGAALASVWGVEWKPGVTDVKTGMLWQIEDEHAQICLPVL